MMQSFSIAPLPFICICATGQIKTVCASELFQFDASEKYLRDVLQERFDPKKLPPITKWQEELTAKTAEQDSLYREHLTLKDETAKVEKIRRSVAEILHSESPERISQKSRCMEL